ncbi:50S ribosomal protein L1 [Candidatus Lokiarchaeum ossiferum]|uniref:50S ribosomal protein L1 n=1 Tax=Candidatus Lokiarchaeum ossiferum TaxID=2951803 RepID=A0ABY6HWL4_9ARCH|nr:50S ribosomal protein L1 [Candidatus Lokiarchaeum sp. B-35]
MNVDKKEIKKALSTAIEQSVLKMEGKSDKPRKFDETIDLIINVRDVDIKNPNNRIDQEHLLPHAIPGNYISKDVCFIAKDDMEVALKEKGYTVLNPSDLDDMQKRSNKDKKVMAKKYKYFVARADLMRNLAKVLARFLGQQGKMPKPQPKGFGVIKPDEDIDEYLTKLGRIIKISMKKQLLMQLKVGKKSQNEDILYENIESVLNFVEGNLPNGFNNISGIYLKTTMGKPVPVADTGKNRR